MRKREILIAALLTLALWLGAGCNFIVEHDDSPLVELRVPRRCELSIGKPADLAAGRTREPIRKMTLDDVRP